MSTQIDQVVRRSTRVDVSRLYVEARAVGLTVQHSTKNLCHDFDGLPVRGCALGVFRNVGDVVFWKDSRRWDVFANADCGPVELATLIEHGIYLAETFGRRPGHYTRKRNFHHSVSPKGHPYAAAGVCFQLNADDLLESRNATAEVDVDRVVEQLLKA